MKDFINSFGSGEFIIIIAIVVAILIALVILIYLEKRTKFKNREDDTDFDNDDVESYNNDVVANEVITSSVRIDIPIEPVIDEPIYFEEPINNDEFFEEYDEIITEEPIKEEPIIESNPVVFEPDPVIQEPIIYETPIIIETPAPVIEEPEEEIYYEVEDDIKTTIESVKNKLIRDDLELNGPTKFEIEQEEKSVISYDELKKVNYDLSTASDAILGEDGDEPISIDELYNKYKEEKIQKQEANKDQIEKPEEVKKFKNTTFISPVFGVYNQHKKTEIKESDDIEKTVDLKDLEMEIRKTEEFLKDLKKLKGKLD